MLTNIKSLKDYLVEVLKVPEKAIQIVNKDGNTHIDTVRKAFDK